MKKFETDRKISIKPFKISISQDVLDVAMEFPALMAEDIRVFFHDLKTEKLANLFEREKMRYFNTKQKLRMYTLSSFYFINNDYE